MPNIKIVEYDQTTPGTNADSLDVVYIPGFVDVATNFGTNPEDALPVNQPTLFTDVVSFESRCGTRGAVFEEDQYYKAVGGIDKGFAEVAVPYTGVMFTKGTVDPGYVMAKELLSAGLNVLYERVNPDSETLTIKGTQPEDWASTYNSYKVLESVYTKTHAVSMPELMDIQNGKTYNKDATYYTREVVIDEDGNTNIIFTPISISEEDVDEHGKILSKSEASQLYYSKSKDEYYLAKAVASGTQYAANKYYRYDTEKGYLVVINDEAQPAGWPAGAYSQLKESDKVTLIEYVASSESISTQSTGQDEVPVEKARLTFSTDWINNWANSFIKSEVYVSNTSETFDSSKTYQTNTSSINISVMYNALSSIFDANSDSGLIDQGNYSIKYLTSGGYPVYEYSSGALVTKMMNVAATRGDCVAIIDHTDNPDRDENIDHPDSIYQTVCEDVSIRTNGEFATMFTPWAEYNRTTTDKKNNKVDTTIPTSIRMPASYAYLLALADSIKTNANWLAIAGSARGTVPNLAQDGMTTNIPNGAADKMQPRNGIAINPITNINPYGYVIWGNRTLKNNATQRNLTATSFLNIRNLVSDIKKVCYRAARKLTFEQNNDILWVNFKSLVNPTLDTMVAGYGLSGYKVVKDTTHPKASEKATLCVKIILYPVYAVEDFYISIVLKDDDTTVEEA